MYNVYTSDQGLFLEMQFWGGKLFLWGRENPKNFQKQTKFNIVFKLGGGGFPPKGPEKTKNKKKTVSDSSMLESQC